MKQIAFSPRYGLVRLDAGQFDEIEAMDVLEHAPDLTAFMTRGHELRARGLAEEEIFRTPRAVDDMQVVLVKRMVTQPEREAALAWQRGARHGPPAPEAEPANVQKAGLSQSLSAIRSESAVSSLDMLRKPWIVALLVAASATLVTACDQQKVADAVNAIKPDSMAFGGLRIGVSTVEDVRRQAGKPEMVWEDDDGAQRLEYPRGPNGLTTWMLDFDADGKLVAMTQALTAQNIAQVVPGMTQDEVRRLLGKPSTVASYALSHEEVWSWHWAEGGVAGDGMFNAHFSPDGLVIRTSRSDAPGHEQH